MAAMVTRRKFLAYAAMGGAAAAVLPLPTRALGGQLKRRGPAKKVIVIGAGLAGLSATYELTQAGHDVTLLEAQLRPGGRVLTLREPFSDGLYAEAGAMVIPETHNLTLHYVRMFNLALDPELASSLARLSYVRGQRIIVRQGTSPDWPFALSEEDKKLSVDGMFEKYETAKAYEEIGDPSAPEWSVAALRKYDEVSYTEFLRRNGASPGIISTMSHSWSQLWGEGWETVSALTILRDWTHQARSRQNYRIRGGNDLLPKAFAERLKEQINYGAQALRIEHTDTEVRVTFQQGGTHHRITADRLVCAIPFSVLRRIEVSPPFSPEKKKTVEQLPYFSSARVSIQCRRKFWLDQELNGSVRTDLPIGEIFDITLTQPGPRGVLQCYAGGPNARRIMAMLEQERIEFVLEHMARVFPEVRENFEGGVSKCWDEDPWARGASSWYKPGQMTEFWPHVARAEGRVHFAGDHTSPYIRWMQGALHSGNRAAREVNEAMD